VSNWQTDEHGVAWRTAQAKSVERCRPLAREKIA
jgi:hypothetical protein